MFYYAILSRNEICAAKYINTIEVSMPMHVNESAENYLETILMLSQTLPVVRSVDIATELNFKKSSVSVAMKKLRESNHIVVSPEGYITLTESGKEIADCIYETTYSPLFLARSSLGVDPQVAVDDACRIEHVISAESFEAIKNHIRRKRMQRSDLHPFSRDSGPVTPLLYFLFFNLSEDLSSVPLPSFSVSPSHRSLKPISRICSAPLPPTIDGMLRHSPSSPYSPFRETDTGITVWLSLTIASAILAAAIPIP